MKAVKETARSKGTDSARVVQVIMTTTMVGEGTEESPIRELVQFWSFDGQCLATNEGVTRDVAVGLASPGQQQ